MNNYIALKQVTFGGVKYAVGDTIPTAAILPSRIATLLRSKTIAESSAEAAPILTGTAEAEAPEGVVLNIETDEGPQGLLAKPESIIEAVNILQKNSKEAASAVADVSDDTVLIIIDACDSRITVKRAVKERAAQLEAETEQGSESGEG